MDKERILLKVDDLKIVGEVYMPGHLGKGYHPAVCLCHGVPGRTKVPGDKGYPFLAERICGEGFLVLLFNFRGTGESGGNLDLLGWTRDLAAAIDFLWHHEGVDKSRISLMGFSGGAAAAIYVAARDHRVSSIVTCACPAEFSRLLAPEPLNKFVEQAREIGTIRERDFPPSLEEWARGFEEVSPIKWIDQIEGRPIFLIHGSGDQVVDASSAWRLYQKAGEPKAISIIEGAEHRIRHDERAISSALRWLKKVNGLE